jgi:hypothetical protein
VKARRRDPYGEPQAYAQRFVDAGRPRPTQMTVAPKPFPPPEPGTIGDRFSASAGGPKTDDAATLHRSDGREMTAAETERVLSRAPLTAPSKWDSVPVPSQSERNYW